MTSFSINIPYLHTTYRRDLCRPTVSLWRNEEKNGSLTTRTDKISVGCCRLPPSFANPSDTCNPTSPCTRTSFGRCFVDVSSGHAILLSRAHSPIWVGR
ncbi:hypothetical protein AVEN_218290-1 [Araneus ventricosus]|uniref:Uncharacterized protein n=1 Tax=Araneus ventricosus TaxID=182803 RepID=A0A4Y2SX13_ARAVE|nr:hypothetical protein AVEN_218290-1 [Araneus ventricosus]